MTKIKLDTVKRIVMEELKLQLESVDHESIRDIVTIASKLMSAVEEFKQKATPAATNAVTPHLGDLEKILEAMINTPGSYVSKPSTIKKVTLKPVKGAKVV
jgi:hypothetical protein